MIVHIFCAIKCVFLFIPSNPVRRFCANRPWRYPILQTQRRHFMSFAYIQLFSRPFRCYLRSCNLFKTFCHCSSVLLTAAYIRYRPSLPMVLPGPQKLLHYAAKSPASFFAPLQNSRKKRCGGQSIRFARRSRKGMFPAGRPAYHLVNRSVCRAQCR